MAYQQTRDQLLEGLAWGLLACIRIAKRAGLSLDDLTGVIINEWTR